MEVIFQCNEAPTAVINSPAQPVYITWDNTESSDDNPGSFGANTNKQSVTLPPPTLTPRPPPSPPFVSCYGAQRDHPKDHRRPLQLGSRFRSQGLQR